MTTQLLFYGEITPVNKNRHLDLYIKAGKDYAFAQNVNSVPLTAVEFPSAAAEYPIVFGGNEEQVLPAVILGTEDQENLFVSESANWEGKFIPAFVRRYPFVFSTADNGETLTLCIDESYPGCNKEGLGERLFDAEGEQTQYLKSVLNFLKEYQAHSKYTETFCKKLLEWDLLQPLKAEFTMPEGSRRSLSGFFGVDREKLKALEPDQLTELMRSDGLELIYLHLQSMNNFKTMLENARPASDSLAAPDEESLEPELEG
jgi:hypothetical protein